MNKLLVPIDFSENSLNALRYAVEVAKIWKSEITLFNSYPIDVPMGMEYSSGVYMQSLNAEVKFDHKLHMKEIVAGFQHEHYHDSVQPLIFHEIVQEGVAADSICQIAEDQDFDLIVMGTQGASGLEEILLGSITVSVIEKVNVPVMAIPEKATFKGLKKIVYATNFDEKDCEVIDSLQDFGEYFDAELTCLHINTSPEKVMDEDLKMHALQRNYFFTPLSKLNFKLLHHKRVEKGIMEYLEENSVDLVAIMPQNRSFVENLFHTSLTKKMAFHSTIPLLVSKN